MRKRQYRALNFNGVAAFFVPPSCLRAGPGRRMLSEQFIKTFRAKYSASLYTIHFLGFTFIHTER